MSIQLKLDEMLEIMHRIDHAQAANFKWALETIGTAMAERIAAQFCCNYGPATFQGTAFAGTCSPFYPAHRLQECPEIFGEYDSADEWEQEAKYGNLPENPMLLRAFNKMYPAKGND